MLKLRCRASMSCTPGHRRQDRRRYQLALTVLENVETPVPGCARLHLVAVGAGLDIGGELLAWSGDLKLDLQAVLARGRVCHSIPHLVGGAIAQKHHPEPSRR